MSLFKKPRRNIRRRDFDSNEENEEDGDSKMDTVDSKKSGIVKTTEMKPKKEKKKQSVLSFDEEWDEGDDGEIFQVKKSSQSKKIRKLMDKERKKKKDGKPDSSEFTNTKENSSEITIIDEITIKIKNNLPVNRVLNGREAEMAEKDGISSDEDSSASNHTFSHPDLVKQLLKKGQIPDAAMIHAARKRRQQAREMGGDYIPVEDKSLKYEISKSSNTKSRLVREDDNDGSDDEERITMAVNTAAIDKEKRREAFHAALEEVSEESDRGEEEEWEKQQIRKGVTGAQIAAVQQENLYYAYAMPPEVALPSMPMESSVLESMPVQVFPPLPNIMGTGKVDHQSIARRLQDRLEELKEVHRRHTLDRDERAAELTSLRDEANRLKDEAPGLAERFRFYQDLRGYVTDLVECLDEKVVILVALEQRILNLYQRRATDLITRRRQDIKDQAEELALTSKNVLSKRDETQVRRAAEREGRRIRRMKAREARTSTKHIDGMSSDDEITEMEASSFRNNKEQVEQDARHVFEDALDEFSTIKGVLQRFDTWKKNDRDAYTEAYVNICLPKVLGPLIRLQILTWSPFIQSGVDLERTRWNHSLLLYNLGETETEESLKEDPDVQLVPRAVEKIILPKLDQLVCAQWDPMSSTQTLALVSIVTKFLQDYPTLGPSSKVLTLLLNNIVDKMTNAVENDIYIPIYPRQMADGRMIAFFNRQFASAVKLLSNIVRWQGLLNDEVLCKVALDALLNRYLLLAMRTCDTMDAALKCHMIGSVLPRVWLHTGSIPQQLIPLLNQARLLAQQLDSTKPLARDALEKLSVVLKAAP